MKKNLIVCYIAILLPAVCFSQNTISGKVFSNKDNSPLTGANVIVKESFMGIQTGNDGSYRLEGLKKKRVLIQVSYLGFETQEKEVNTDGHLKLDFYLEESALLQDEVIISATKVDANTPSTHTLLQHAEIKKLNTGQDLPFLLDQTPSVVVSSDAGTGIGYTGIRIRGTDISRINVTVNGIPLNDPESHGVWFVNMPDFASSLDNIQIQRGVGTSVNGAAAFGASINFQTETLNKEAYSEVNTSLGSYQTFIENVKAGTGLIHDKFTMDVRLSKLQSDGYIDRASSNLESFFVSTAYYAKNQIIKLNIFSGKEKTYQAWNGVPKVRLNDDDAGMKAYLDNYLFTDEEYQHMLNSDSRTYNFYTYDNETDNYQQDHYQLLYSININKNLNASAALHMTKGRGFYEQYKKDEDFGDYSLPAFIINNDSVFITDLIRQKWLDNLFYGITYSLNYKKNKLSLIAGGAWNRYDGDHFGKITWSEFGGENVRDYQWYFNNGIKTDFNVFSKVNYSVTEKVNFYGDAQIRKIDYTITGIHDDLRDISTTKNYLFFNPKIGAVAHFDKRQKVYLSLSVANREPSRSTFRDAAPNDNPVPERLLDYEAGYSFNSENVKLIMNVFYMSYNNQLVMTGQINDVGAVILKNIPESYRRGIELSTGYRFRDLITWNFNATFSQNKVLNFVEYVDDWDNGGQVSNDKGATGLSFSPQIISGSDIGIFPFDNFELHLLSKYVSRQYIDNSSNKDLSLDPYFVNHLLIRYSLESKNFPDMDFALKINNLLNEEYETFAWAYRYYYNGSYNTMDGYFPQASRNYLAQITLRF